MEQGAKGKEQEKQGEKPNERTIQWLALSTMLCGLSVSADAQQAGKFTE
jgi:hypothetical protein